MHFILIDGSYFIFYRFHALIAWWKHANKIDLENASQCQEFIDKFTKVFIQKVEEIPKKINKIISHTGTNITIVLKDCPRSEIWRMQHLPLYKGTRVTNKKFDAKFFFNLAYNELYKQSGVNTIISSPNLEADDCVALTAKHITKEYPDAHISIIANDMDYLQLCSNNVKLYDLKFNDIAQTTKSTGDPLKDLFCKIVMGDKSDNISGIFPKCGIKTALKYYDNPELFHNKLLENPEYNKLFERNKLIIDFNNIPPYLVEQFYKDCLLIK